MRESERDSEKEITRRYSEKEAFPKRGNEKREIAVLSRTQSERGGEILWDAKQFDCDSTRGRAARIASEACLPSETIMRPLGPREWRGWERKGGKITWFHLHLQTLASLLHTNAPMNAPAPVTPEDRLRTDSQRMQQKTHLARFGGRTAIPLALLAQRAGTTIADAGRIHHTQTPIAFSASLMGVKRLPSRTPERPIGLQRKVLTRKATCFPGRAHRRGSIA